MLTAFLILGVFTLAGAIAVVVSLAVGLDCLALKQTRGKAGWVLLGAVVGSLLVWHAGQATWAVGHAMGTLEAGICQPCAEGGE